MYEYLYKKFLNAHAGKTHFTAHSHHFWPDVTQEAINKAWLDSAKFSDQKWDHILGKVLPTTQSLIAKILNLKYPEQIAIAPNTHELVTRLLSCFLGKKKIKVLTTTSEFHSFKRQINRLKEYENFDVTIINNEKENFEENFINSVTEDLDLIFISHVFFNSGKVNSNEFIHNIIKKKNKETIFCLDAYHGFCAIPTDLSAFEGEIFYLAGGYKYAQAGEGMCFMTIPKDCQLRPAYTGWFASFESLENENDTVDYSHNGFRFWGATQDLTCLYRFNAVWNQFFNLGVDINKIHTYIQSLQSSFLEGLEIRHLFMETNLKNLGHFLTLNCHNSKQALEVHDWLKDEGFLSDYRGARLRFGFGLYLNLENIKNLRKFLNQNYLQKFP